MAKRRKKGSKKEMRSQIKAILLLALAVFCYIGLVGSEQTGGIGLFVSNILRTLAGEAALVIPITICLLALSLLLPLERLNIKNRLFGLIALQLLYTIWIHIQLIIERMPNIPSGNLFFESFLLGMNQEGGGVIGSVFAGSLLYLIGSGGSRILIVAFALISALMVLNITVNNVLNTFLQFAEKLIRLLNTLGRIVLKLIREVVSASQTKINNLAIRRNDLQNKTISASVDEHEIPEPNTVILKEPVEKEGPLEISGYPKESILKETVFVENNNHEMFGTPTTALVNKQKPVAEYLYPPQEYLSLPVTNGEQQHLKNSKIRAKLLENTLLSFGVKAKVVHVQSGPTVTRFEVQPEAGVKVSKIISLSDDLALNLAASLVRIEAPIPGKAALGIEVPNKVISLVHLREVMEDATFKNSSSPLTIGLGKDITGIPVIADLTKMPHLLIAGATGAGKSMCLNAIITSILYKAGPEKVRFIMVDPKVVELSIYNGIPHLLMPVLTDPRKASLALRQTVKEMTRRYDLFANHEVRDINAYNDLAARDHELETLAYIVVVIDELADLMSISPGEVEDSIARLAQMSRAAGVHLLVATQRPSVDVLTGIIKANITSRVAFTVSSQFDSRTILDMAGAEKLLGSGDMLFYPVGAVKPFRVQGAYVSEAELRRITDYIKKQKQVECQNGTTFLETPDEIEAEETDALFTEAIDLVVRTGHASISLFQRRFRIGYTRAARLIDDLEMRGIVGPFEGSKPREVLITAEQAVKICEEHTRKNGC